MAQQGNEALEAAERSARDADRALDDATGRSSFTSVVASVSDRQVELATLGTELARARTRGWIWGRDWEAGLAMLQATAGTVLASVRTESSAATNRVRGRIEGCRSKLTRTPVNAGNKGALDRIEDEAKSVQQAVGQEEDRLQALAKPFVEPFDRLKKEVAEAHEHLGRFEDAKFRLAAGENPWVTGETTWQDAPGGAVNGFLYLTDKRIRFEQKETITTKKFLFFTASSEEKHACLIDEPVGNIAQSDDSTKGLVFKDQLVTIRWQNTKLKSSTFDINSGETAKLWDTWIEELRSGQIAHRRAAGGAAPDPGQGMPVDAPTRCLACDAALEAVVRGMTVLTCRYCGQRHDLKFA